jgi:DNA repair protein RecO (recombination protein O)
LGLFKTSGVVLKNRRFSEADKIVVIFSPEHGRVEAIAKGARRTKSKFGGRLEPFTLARFLCYQGKSWPIITQLEVEETHRLIKEDPNKLPIGFEALQLIDKLSLPGREERELFELLLNFLKVLEAQSGNYKTLLAAFEIKILALLGYGLRLSFCGRCEREISSSTWFSWEQGGLICPSCLKQRDEDVIKIDHAEELKWLLSSPFVEVLKAGNKLGEEALSFLEDCFAYYFDIELTPIRSQFF